MNVARVRHWFGEVKEFPHISRLLRVLSPGAPVDVAPGGDLQAEIDYGNHPSPEPHGGNSRQDCSGCRERACLGV